MMFELSKKTQKVYTNIKKNIILSVITLYLYINNTTNNILPKCFNLTN